MLGIDTMVNKCEPLYKHCELEGVKYADILQPKGNAIRTTVWPML